jgi:hypothetical protein
MGEEDDSQNNTGDGADPISICLNQYKQHKCLPHRTGERPATLLSVGRSVIRPSTTDARARIIPICALKKSSIAFKNHQTSQPFIVRDTALRRSHDIMSKSCHTDDRV